MSKKILIFGKTRRDATVFLENLIGEMKYKDIHRFKKSVNETFAELKDGTTYQFVPASQSSRGYKCDKVYIERRTDKEIIDNVIVPMLICSKLPKEDQIEYF